MNNRRVFLCVSLFLFCAFASAAGIKDTESATHGDEASRITLIETYDYPGFRVFQFNLAVISHYSFIVQSGDKAIVFDPDRDVDAYLQWSKEHNTPITDVFLTHSNADFVAGHIELAKRVGAVVHQNADSGAGYPIQGHRQGDVFTLGKALFHVLATPGHTPDGLSVWVASVDAPQKPLCMFTGDALFVGSVGRPDLMGGAMSASTLAGMMFNTWQTVFSPLPDDLVVFPAHGAGSLCGAHLRDEPKTTIGIERKSNPYLQHKSKSEFIAAVLEGLPEAPQYFKHNAAMNRAGPPLVDWEKLPAVLAPASELTNPEAYFVVDLRDAIPFAEGHIPNSVNIGLRGRVETWLGTMVPWGSQLVLCGSEDETAEATWRLHRIGYEPVGRLTFESWKTSALPVLSNQKISALELNKQIQAGTAPIIIDVRLPSEWMGLRIGTILNMPINKISQMSSIVAADQPVVTVCNSAYRSSMAIGILERRGFHQVMSLLGGTQAWIDAGLPTFQAVAHSSDTAKPGAIRQVNLPDRLSADELKRLMLDLPGSFELVDIRPAASFADYSLPGSKRVDIADLLDNPVYLTGAAPLIVVDRDGTLAMMTAAILSQKTKRPVKALFGGLQSFWTASPDLPGGAMPSVVPAPQPAQPSTVPTSPATPAPETRKPRSAGC